MYQTVNGLVTRGTANAWQQKQAINDYE